MLKNLTKNVLRTSALALACLASVGAEVRADLMSLTSSTSSTGTDTSTTTSSGATATATATPTETYSTSGTIGTAGVTNSNGDTGPGPIGFTQLTTGSFGLNSQVSLGAFAVSSLSDGSTTSYNNTPFTITYNPLMINGDNNSSDKFPNKPITITGVLNGDLNGNQSSVQAKFNLVDSPVFSTADGTYLSTISIAQNPLSLVPSTSFGGLTSIQASVTTTAVAPPSDGSGGGVTPTPEPTTFAILATSLIGLGLRQRLRSARKVA